MLYNLALFFLLLIQAVLSCFSKKRFPQVRARVFFPKELFSFKKEKFWFHAVSFGEVKALRPFLEKMQKNFPEGAFFLSTVTVTGFEEAKKIPFLKVFYLPFDFSWIQRKILKIAPTFLFLMEGDFWKNMLYYAKKAKAKVVLLNGKISERSCARFSKLPFFSKKLFSYIDLFLLQNEEYKKSFLKLKVPKEKLFVTGNMKLHPVSLKKPSLEKKVEKSLSLNPFFVLTIGSSHDPEEKLLLQQILPLLQEEKLKVFLAPRHPERALSLLKAVEKLKIKTALFSEEESSLQKATLILIDQMGVLPFCYKYSHVAIVAGSFDPALEGHNLIEPALYNTPVIFGPHTKAQQELKKIALEQKIGVCLSLEEVYLFLKKVHQDKEKLEVFQKATFSLQRYLRIPLEKTWSLFLDKACVELSLKDKL